MFTGIIESFGKVVDLEKQNNNKDTKDKSNNEDND